MKAGNHQKHFDELGEQLLLNLGACYANGRGIAKDERSAVGWCRKATDQWHAGAAVNLEQLSNGSGNKMKM